MVGTLLASADYSIYQSEKGWIGRDNAPLAAIGGDSGLDGVTTTIEY